MLTLLEKIAATFWKTLLRLVALFTPFFTQARYLQGMGRALLWTLHIFLVLATLAGLYFLNWKLGIFKDVASSVPWLRDFYLPLLFCIAYLLCWLGLWLWRLLQPEAELVEFPDIEQAWREGVQALHQAGLELTEVPLFLVSGTPSGGEESFFAAAQLQLKVKMAPSRLEAPIRLYGSREGIFVTCAGASLLGRQCALLQGGTEGGRAGFGEDAEDDPYKTMVPKGRLKEVQDIFRRAKEQGRDPGQLTDAERDEIRQIMAAEKAESASRTTGPRPNILKDAQEADLLKARLRYLCQLIVRDRAPYCPFNGMLLLVPFAATATDEDAAHAGAVLQQELATVRSIMQVNCPVFLLLTDMEQCPGFKEFVERFPLEQRKRRLGQRLPLVPDLANGESLGALLDRGAGWVCNSLFPTYMYRFFRLEQSPSGEDASAAVRSNVRLYQLMVAMRERRQRLSRILTRSFTGEQSGPTLFGGCYVAGTGRDVTREQAFIAGVLHRLIENQNAVSWTPQALQEEARYERYTRTGYTILFFSVTLAVVLLVFLWKFY